MNEKKRFSIDVCLTVSFRRRKKKEDYHRIGFRYNTDYEQHKQRESFAPNMNIPIKEKKRKRSSSSILFQFCQCAWLRRCNIEKKV